jgi:hypothetical protein
MDKSWINSDARHTKEYSQGVNIFLTFAFRNSTVGDKILCPCRKCVNSFWRDSSEIQEHLICNGFLQGYTIWNLHGKASSSFVDIDNGDGADPVDECSEEDDIACGLDDRGDFEDNSSDVLPKKLVDLQKLPKKSMHQICLRK